MSFNHDADSESEQSRLLYEEMEARMLHDPSPEHYFCQLENPIFKKEYPFILLNRLKSVPQSPTHHPEGSAWNHTMLVLNQAAKQKDKSRNIRAFMWAALLHDIGKAETTKHHKGKITAYDHDKVGARLADKFLRCFTDDLPFITEVTALVRWHMQVLYVVKGLPFADIARMKKETDPKEVALLSLCDRLGRLGADQRKEEADIMLFMNKMTGSIISNNYFS